MKKLFLVLFSIMSFNSYGGWFDKTICVETDSQETDGIIYLPSQAKPFTGNNLCKHANGQKKSKGKVEDGKRYELWTEWYESGEIKFESSFNDGKIDKRKNYENENIVGQTLFYYHYNGILSVEIDWKLDAADGKFKKHGKETKWHNNGQLKSEQNFKDGEMDDGKWTTWYENGQKESDEFIKDGNPNGVQTGWHENGQKKVEVNFKDGKEDGKINQWHENGQLELERYFKDGKAVGRINAWHANGQLEEDGNFKDGKLDGKMTHFYENGSKYVVETYKDGKLDGKVVAFAKNGVIIFEQIYINDKCVKGDCHLSP